jgi:hypothetical protein
MEHVPTRMQVRAMAHFDGREPRSYLLEPAVKLRTRAAARGRGCAGAARPRFTGDYGGSARRFELVALPDGGAFDLLGMSV